MDTPRKNSNIFAGQRYELVSALRNENHKDWTGFWLKRLQVRSQQQNTPPQKERKKEEVQGLPSSACAKCDSRSRPSIFFMSLITSDFVSHGTSPCPLFYGTVHRRKRFGLRLIFCYMVLDLQCISNMLENSCPLVRIDCSWKRILWYSFLSRKCILHSTTHSNIHESEIFSNELTYPRWISELNNVHRRNRTIIKTTSIFCGATVEAGRR